MGNSEVRRGDVIVKPLDLNQVAEWMTTALRGRVFKVVSREEEFDNELFAVEGCRLDDEINHPPVRYYSSKMLILFCLDAPEDVSIPVGGFGKLTIIFLKNGFVVENKGVGRWEFIVEKSSFED